MGNLHCTADATELISNMQWRQLLNPFANSVRVETVASLSALRHIAVIQEPIAAAPTHRLSPPSFV
jgi:hypothetical protein